MVKPKQFEIVFDRPLAVYHPGQTIQGHVVLCLTHKLKMRSISLELNGRGRVHWKDNTGRSGRMVYYRAEEEYFHRKIMFFGTGTGDESIHPTGSFVYPFEMDLPTELPSSFEGNFGFVRYSAKANIDIKMGRDYDIKSAFTVLSHLDLNTEPEDLEAPVEGRSLTPLSCCLLASGDVSAEFGLDRSGFVAGETVRIRGRIVNNSTTVVKKSRVELKQYVEYFGVPDTMFSSKEPKPCRVDSCLSFVERDPIEPGEADLWSDVALLIPPIPPSRLDRCNIINISYTVEFIVWIKYGSKMTLSADIIIGSIPFHGLYGYCPPPPLPLPLPPDVVTSQPKALTTVTANGDVIRCHLAGDSKAEPEVPVGDDAGGRELRGNGDVSKRAVTSQYPAFEFRESRQGRVNIREEGESRAIKGQLFWAPVYITYTLSPLMEAAARGRPSPTSTQEPETVGATDVIVTCSQNGTLTAADDSQ